MTISNKIESARSDQRVNFVAPMDDITKVNKNDSTHSPRKNPESDKLAHKGILCHGNIEYASYDAFDYLWMHNLK